MIRTISTLTLLFLFTGCIQEGEMLKTKEEKNMKTYTNRLAEESSPYLLQHAHNPVDWYPWGEEAFEAARREDKLIFLSIGYSTCHWCHVMERESFEDEKVAELMNSTFISIKVDREERPDIDSIYMEVAMMLNGQGGWPLNLILTPDLHPVFAATYIPKEGNTFRMGMLNLIPQIESAWKERRGEIVENGEKILQALKEHNNEASNSFSIDSAENLVQKLKEIQQKAYSLLEKRYDAVYGGFGDRPKFPQPHNFLFLLRYYEQTGRQKVLEMVETTLQKMRAGGIYDHIGFGFHRYSTDREWKVPHFEKMLYDQAMLLLAYTETYLVTGDPQYQQVADEIITYLLRDMQSPEGAFFSAEDADSEGVEGKYYLWEYDDLVRLLGEDGREYARFFNLEEEGNFVDEARQVKTGENILFTKPGAGPPEGPEKLEEMRKHIFSYREERVRPHLDDKILTDWNGLIIFALARASWVFDNSDYYAAAEKTAEFILSEMKTSEGALLHAYRNGRKGTEAMIDDYAFLIRGLLELYRADYQPSRLVEAVDLMDYATDHFLDEKNGGFFLSAAGRDDVLIRKKELIDNAVPSGNSLMAENGNLLFRLTGKEKYLGTTEGIIETSMDELMGYPQAFGMLLSSLYGITENPREIVIVGEEGAAREMAGATEEKIRPGTTILVITPENAAVIGQIAPYTSSYTFPDSGAAAYVCENFTCKTPVFTPEALLSIF